MFVITRLINLYRKLKTAPRALPSNVVQITSPKVFISILLTRTQVALCLCKDPPFTKMVSRCVNASTDQGALVACYSCLRTTKAPVGTSKED